MKTTHERFGGPVVWLLLATAVFGTAYSAWSLITGRRYVAALEWVDVSTVLFLSLLLGRGAYVLRREAPLKVVALCLLNMFSFIYCFESIYKFLFFGWLHTPGELRDVLLQAAAALTILLAFYYRDFRLSSRALAFGALYLLTMAAWSAIGYPQLYMGRVHPGLVDVEVGKQVVYAINRVAKGILFLAYFFLYSEHPPLLRR